MKRSFKRLFSVVCGVSALASFVTNPAQALVNGKPVDANDPVAQTTVGILTRDAHGDGICSGTLISNNQVLSAGHCATGIDVKIYIIFHTDMRVGFKDPMRTRLVTDRKIDPSFILNGNTGKDHKDVSIMTFTGGIPAGTNYHPAKLMSASLAPFVMKDEARITLAGYGATDYYARGGEPILRKISTKIDKYLASGKSVKVGTHAHGACHGDSGGPAFIDYNGQSYVFAVTSRATSTSDGECTGRAIYSLIY